MGPIILKLFVWGILLQLLKFLVIFELSRHNSKFVMSSNSKIDISEIFVEFKLWVISRILFYANLIILATHEYMHPRYPHHPRNLTDSTLVYMILILTDKL